MKVEVDVLGSPSLIFGMLSVDVKQHELVAGQSSGAVSVKVEVAILGFPSGLIVLVVSGRNATVEEDCSVQSSGAV